MFATSLEITTTCPLPTGEVGIAYSDTLVAVGGSLPYTWSLNSGSLPSGLSLATNGNITGTPTLAGSSSFVLRVTDGLGNTITKSCSMTVAPAVSITTVCPLDDGTEDEAYLEVVTATGGMLPYTWTISAGALPDGLSMAADGTISGTPTTVQVGSFTLHVEDALGSVATLSCQITINPAAFLFSDDFNRADGLISTGQPLWGAVSGAGMPQITSMAVIMPKTPSLPVAYVPSTPALTFNYARIDFVGANPAVNAPMVSIGVLASNTLGNLTGYFAAFGWRVLSGTRLLELWRYNAGTAHLLWRSASEVLLDLSTQEIQATIGASDVTVRYLQNGSVMQTIVDNSVDRITSGVLALGGVQVSDGIHTITVDNYVGGGTY
jgi:hypothetical protein